MKRILLRLTYPFVRLYWELFKPKTFGVKVIIEHAGQWLLIKNSYGGDTWTFPGGGIDKGESPTDAAVREVKEEVGFVLDSGVMKELGSYVTTHEGKIDTVYVFHAAGAGAIAVDGTEVITAEWFSRMNLPENLGIQAKKCLEMWHSKTPR